MSNLPTGRPRRKVRAVSPARAASPAALRPVVDPFRATAGRLPDPDEQPDPCPRCGGETMWCIDQRTRKPQRVCTACTEYRFDPSDLESGHH